MQLGLPFSTVRPRGGARVGAGRKRLPPGLRHTPHRSRPIHRGAHPVHVTMRAAVRSLRSPFVAPTVLGALRAANRADFRIVHYSIQSNHLHLLVEARSSEALASGMRGLAVRLARRINRLLFRRGRIWLDRWHGNELSSPRQVRNALVYVLQNRAKHSDRTRRAPLDPWSSALDFDGFVGCGCTARAGPAFAQTWLLSIGWRRHGLIRQEEVPAR